MKKLAILLSLSFLMPLLGPAVSHGAETYSDLAIGDPLSGHRRSKRRAVKKPAETTTPPSAPAAAPAEKPAEKPAEAAK